MRIIAALLATAMILCLVLCCLAYWLVSPPPFVAPITITPTATLTKPARPDFGFLDVWNVAIILTYEGQVFPEPDKTRAFRAIAWTMRNRLELGQGVLGYSDEQNLLSKYASYKEHKQDLPDPHAIEVALEVMNATTRESDETHGARNFVDNSFWTGTHQQTGTQVSVPGKFSDADIQRLVNDGKFNLVIEWRAPKDHPKGPLFYALYFFDYWPPATPVVTPTFTPTPRPTATMTRTPTRTSTPTITLTPTRTLTPTKTLTPTMTITATMTLAPTETPTVTETPGP